VPNPSPGRIDINRALAIIQQLHNDLRVDLGSNSTRDSRNAFFESAVAVIHYGHARWNPGGGDNDWCIKDGGSGRPQSDDVIVRCSTRDAWDTISGVGANGYHFQLEYIGKLPSNQNVYPPRRSALP